ncbi:hypothetical protein [Streptomyces sp. bgisy060]|uniref:hypothetical protein n=1 Tax=Streptomyces sp. bgisy060 TaxID=3413775 RepID=UPI003EBC36FB
MTTPTLSAECVTIALDQWGQPVAVLPDDVAARLSAASREQVKDYGYGHFESRRFPADSYETRAIHAIFEAVLAAHPEEQGLTQYQRYRSGYFYGFVVGESGWDLSAQSWRNYGATRHLRVYGLHLDPRGSSHFGS